MTEESDKSKTVFFGPAQNSWYKYKLGQMAVKLTTEFPRVRKNFIGSFVFNWGIKNTIGARETETINEESV
jgi:hypothetical protein